MSKLTLGIVIFTFIVFGIWFAMDLLHTKPSVDVSPELQQALEPIDPSFDETTIQMIQSLEDIPTGAARAIPVTATPNPIPAPNITNPSPTATPTPPPNLNFGNNSATDSGTPWEYQPYSV